ncbi:hypothetical protein [Microbacterium sp. NPDC058345]|uniref:hypothetical protein n=1 Tax=Microbacterium sp. NPDC058345 TaxID=3346455 RepID=UPI00364EDE0C
MSDDTRQTVRSGCVHLSEIEDKHKNRLRVYWGTIRFPRPKEDGGAWLNTGRGSPTIVIEEDELVTLLERSGLEELEDLSGSFFAIMGKLRHGRTAGSTSSSTRTSTGWQCGRSSRTKR